MKNSLPILLLLLAGCKQEVKQNNFTADLAQLQDYFHIPGMATIVTHGDEIIYENYSGYADIENKVPVDSATVFPMASLTKIFTGYIIMQTPELLDREVESSFKVRDVLSHTSQGDIGKHFYYSGARFNLLTRVIEDQMTETFWNVTDGTIIKPYSLKNTFLLGDSTDLIGNKVAKPYAFEGETKPGYIDYGYSSAAGIVSTVRDIAKFGKLVQRIPKGQYDYGYFSQDVQGTRVLWAYGQYDCYSSLFIKVPSKDLTLVMAANNNLMSDPARLIYGDVTTSLFALSFFKDFLDLNIDDRRAKAVAESFLARFDVSHAGKSKEYLRAMFSNGDYYDLTTMHTISFLKMVAEHYGQPPFSEFDPQMKAIGDRLLSIDVNNPYANIYMGGYYDSRKDVDSARVHYQRIADLKNFSRNWYTSEAEDWLRQHASTSGSGK